MIRLAPVAVVIAGALEAASPRGSDSVDAARTLTAMVPSVRSPVGDLSVSKAAGHYSSRGKQLEARAGPSLTGQDLYLFADGQYLKTEWGCVMEETIYDRGRWSVDGGVVLLVSDQVIKSRHSTDESKFLAFRYSVGKSTGLRLIGLPSSMKYFRENAGRDPGFMLLICSVERSEVYDVAKSQVVFATLMRTAWNPEFFKD